MSRLVLVLSVLITTASARATDIPRADREGGERQVLDRLNAAASAVEAAPGSADAWGRYAMVLHAHSCRPEAELAYAEAQRLEPDEFRWAYYRGVNLLKTDAAAAIEHLERAVAIDPGYGPAHIRLGIALEEVGRDDDAWKALDEALRLEPDNLSARLHIGQIELQRGNVDVAIEHLEKAREGRPRDAAALSALARAYARQGDRDRARAMADAARKTEPGRVVDDERFSEVVNQAVTLQSFLDRADVYAVAGATEMAVRELLRALEIGHDSGIVHGALARHYLKLGQPARSIESSRAAMATGRDSPEIYLVLALALMRSGRYDEAEVAVADALSLSPSHPQSLWLHGRIAFERGDVDEAVAPLDGALALGDDVRTRTDRAEALARLGRVPEAIEELEALTKVAPSDAAVWLALGDARERAGDLDGAVAAFDRALSFATAPLAGRRAATVLIGRRRFAEAAARLRAMRERWPGNPNLRNDLAWLLATCPDDGVRNGAEAVRLIQPVVRQTGRREPAVLDTLAAALAESGRTDEAAEVMEEAIALLPPGGPAQRRAEYEARRDRYTSGRPWRQP